MSFIRFFVSSFDAADVIENMSTVTINRNQGQAATTTSTDTCKMTRDLNVYQKIGCLSVSSTENSYLS